MEQSLIFFPCITPNISFLLCCISELKKATAIKNLPTAKSQSPVETLHAPSELVLPYLPNLTGWESSISIWKKIGNVFVNKLFGNWSSHLYKQQWRERDRACRGNHLLPGIRWRGRWSGRREHDHFFGAGPRTFLMPHLFLKQKKKKKNHNNSRKEVTLPVVWWDRPECMNWDHDPRLTPFSNELKPRCIWSWETQGLIQSHMITFDRQQTQTCITQQLHQQLLSQGLTIS